MLVFDDGQEFDTRGDVRVETRPDGRYVVGQGVLIPVDTQEEIDHWVGILDGQRSA